MNYWLALYCPPPSAPSPVDPAGGVDGVAEALAGWALQFTPRVARLEDAVVLEVHASLRLFGGAKALRRQLARPARQLGCQRMAWAPTSLAALALARALTPDGFAEPLQQLLDRLPLEVVTAVAEHQALLARLGCRTLGDVRALPRAGLARRFGKGLLDAMDRAYGLQPESHEWIELPEAFDVRMELPGRVENASGLMFGAQRLLLQMGGWLAARHSGVTAFTLSWQHDFHRKAAGPGGELQVRTAHATRHIDHLRRLLAEQLDRLTLAAPVGALGLRVDEALPLEEDSATLFPQREMQAGADAASSSRALDELIERLGARLGADRVLRPVLHADHRMQAMQSFEPAAISRTAWARRRQQAIASLPTGPQPAWVLPEPIPLTTRREKPEYRGPLQLLAGPHRIEVGWWTRPAVEQDVSSTPSDTGSGSGRAPGRPEAARIPPGDRPATPRVEGSSSAAASGPAHGRPEAARIPSGDRPAYPRDEGSTIRVQRDYYVAQGNQVGLLWLYRERQGLVDNDASAPWFLHGIFG